MKYKLIGKNKDTTIYLIYSKNCIYVTDKILSELNAYDNCYGWFVTEKKAMEYIKLKFDLKSD